MGNLRSGYLDVLSKGSLVLSEKEYEELTNTRLIPYMDYSRKRRLVYEGFFRNFIKDERYYNYLSECIDKKSPVVRFIHEKDGLARGHINISLSDVLKMLPRYVDTDIEKEKLRALTDKCDDSVLKSDMKNERYLIYIDGDKIVLDGEELIEKFLLDDQEFEDLFLNKKILGMDKEKFAYALYNFIQDKKILNRYLLDKKYHSRIAHLSDQKYVDYESINAFSADHIVSYDEIELNPKLKKYVYEGMKEEYDDLEKSIFVYIKLCRCLSYDPVFYASGQKGKIAKYHSDINRIASIEGKGDLIVCYEFNAIYAKFLEELNIQYRINKENSFEYGMGHSTLDYRIGKYLVFADSVISILDSDLVNAKLGFPLNGLKCLNKARKTKEKFDDILGEIYSDVFEIEKENNDIYLLLNIYRGLISRSEIEFTQKVDTIFDCINQSSMKTMDSLGYITKIRKIIFTKKELEENVSFVIVKSQLKDNISPIVIITINEKENMYFSKNNQYFYYIPGSKVVSSSEYEINWLFNKGNLQYIRGSKKKIPGIDEKYRRGSL